MTDQVVRIAPAYGQRLRDLLFERGVEFPCGGLSSCGACKVRVVEGDVPVTAEMREALTHEDLEAGWRLGCLAEATGPVTLEVAQWSPQILDDRADVPFEPGHGLGAVVDVGTTTVVAQAVELATGRIVAVASALNPQARYGADLMTRIHAETLDPGVQTRLIRATVGELVGRVAGAHQLTDVLLVGNTLMHHLFAGIGVEPLSAVPFRSPSLGAQRHDAGALGWDLDVSSGVTFLPCIGGFVGSDLLAGIVAVALDEAEAPGALLDLGTNGEVAVGSRAGIRCASTAAGPAFEGGRIGGGMRAGTGAIDRVTVRDGAVACDVIGGGVARGLCGSGLVDAVGCARELGWIRPNGRFAPSVREIVLADAVRLVQADVRELQLAKGAVAAGLQLLLGDQTVVPGRLFLAGAFGNYVQEASARRIGLLPEWAVGTTPAGNTALRGARRLLLAGTQREAILARALSRCEHVELGADPRFVDLFAERMAFPV
jgi:uncharacterized 2Fe-2S/4Fe-4S cluster protein (DUF4445 family)